MHIMCGCFNLEDSRHNVKWSMQTSLDQHSVSRCHIRYNVPILLSLYAPTTAVIHWRQLMARVLS